MDFDKNHVLRQVFIYVQLAPSKSYVVRQISVLNVKCIQEN